MNPLLKEAAGAVSMGWLLGLMTVVFLVTFVAWIWYAWSPANRELMDDAARMPINDGGEG